MKRVWRQRQEQAIVASLVAACLVLAYLQYRWTGELSRAESERLYASASDRLDQFTRAFETEIRQGIQDYIPSAEEVRALGAAVASGERLRNAPGASDRPLFSRIAVAVPDASRKLSYLEAAPGDRKFVAANWPASPDWQGLAGRLQEIALGEPPRQTIVDPATALIEVPVFGDEQEQEWMLFELDMDYVRDKWLPELAKTYLSLGSEESFQVEISVRHRPEARIFANFSGAADAAPDAEGMLFPVRFNGRGRRDSERRWEVRLLHRAGSVPAAVEKVRLRNLGVAMFLLVLIAAAGGELVRLMRQTRRLAEAQYQFFAGLSHELRTPLTIIQGAGHNLLSGVVKDENQRESYAKAIVKQSAHLNEMVEHLLSHASAQKSAGEGDRATSQLDVAVSEAIESVAMELEKSQRSVDVDMPASLPPVRGDMVTLRRVLGNLILNAVRHGDGEVKVSAVRAGGMVEVCVADNGPGIPQDELKQVFDPFFRGHRARTGRTRGTGLGLSLVRETAEKLGGSVKVESETGKGAAFTVRLPVAE